MGRTRRYLHLLLFVISLLFSPAASGEENPSTACLACHEETYVNATSSAIMHTMIENCSICHYLRTSQDMSRKISSAAFRKDIIFILGDLDKEGKKYLLQIDARDTNGNTASPVIINTLNEKILGLPEEQYGLNELSDIKVEKVERKIFAKAVISWSTNVPTAFKIEYGTSKKDSNVLTANNVYAKEHRAVLTGLMHKKNYFFTITSWDMNGKILRSGQLSFDTVSPFDLTSKKEQPADDPDLKPQIGQKVFMKAAEGKDVFIKISSNKPVEFKLTLAEVEGKETRPCDEFTQTITSTITVCNGCHALDSSHPVGIRSTDLEAAAPEDLPTIENGMITCVTCHFGHGSENNYLLRTKAEKELCAKCHMEYALDGNTTLRRNGGDERIRTAE